MKISKEMFVRYLINMKVLIGNEPEQIIKKCSCDQENCAGWIYDDLPFENISEKIKIKHLIIDTNLQTIAEHELLINARICENKLNEYAVKNIGGYISRGVKDGYDMKSVIFDDILKTIQLSIVIYSPIDLSNNIKIFKENDDNGRLWKKIKISERNSPSEFAFDVHDSITTCIRQNESISQLQEFINIKVLPIKLFEMEVQDKEYKKERFTAVIIELKCQVLPATIIVIKADHKD